MSYWSLRRAAERGAAGHALARPYGETSVRAEGGVRLPDWTPGTRHAHPATVASASSSFVSRSLRQRAAELEQALWTVPEQPADDPRRPSVTRRRVPATW